MVRLLPPRDSLTLSTSSLSSVSIPVRPPDVAPTPSPPPTKARPSSSHVNGRGPSLVHASTPSLSSVDARGPSPVPTSTPFPSPPVGSMPTNEDTINLAMEDPSLNDRPMVTLINRAFHPSNVAAKAVTLSIRQQFGQPWPTWGTIPKDQNELLFLVFIRLSEMFRDARNENKRSYWIGDRVWNDLLSHWNAPEYRSKCAQAKKMRHLKRMGVYQVAGSCHSLDEVFQQSHLRKDTGQFVDDRSKQTHNLRLDYLKLGLMLHQVLRSWCWIATTGPKHKGRLYGTGDLAHTYKCGNDSFMQHTQGSSSHAEDAAEINYQREELRQSKEEMRIFQSVVLQFLPPEAWNIIHQQQQPHQQQH
ncbi:hypothetical protein HKD37_17G048693 [Glycine soja]